MGREGGKSLLFSYHLIVNEFMISLILVFYVTQYNTDVGGLFVSFRS